MIRPLRNPLVRRLRRHSNLATLFRLPSTEFESRPARLNHFVQAGPGSGLPVSKAFLPDAHPAERDDKMSALPLDDTHPSQSQPEPKASPAAASLAAMPVQRARAEAAPTPAPAGVQNKAEQKDWQRLQAIVRKHREKDAFLAQSATLAEQNEGTLQSLTIPAPVTQVGLNENPVDLPEAPPLSEKADEHRVQTARPASTPISRSLQAVNIVPSTEVQRSPSYPPPQRPVDQDLKSAKPDTKITQTLTQGTAQIRSAPVDLQASLPVGEASEGSASQATFPASQPGVTSVKPDRDTLTGEASPIQVVEAGGERPEMAKDRDATIPPGEDRSETIAPSGSTRQALPLQAAWPVQASQTEASREIIPSEGGPNEETATDAESLQGELQVAYPEEPTRLTISNMQVSETIQATLQTVKTGQPTDSSIELIPPRKPRPISPSQVHLEQDSKLEPAQNPAISQNAPILRRVEPSKQATGSSKTEAVPTEIGPLPSDLWDLIGVASPAWPPLTSEAISDAGTDRRLERAPERTLAEITPGPETPARVAMGKTTVPLESIITQPAAATLSQAHPQPGGASPAPIIQRQSDAAPAASPEVEVGKVKEAAPTQAEGPDVDELARQVYLEVRRRFALEWERLRRRL